MRCTCNRLGEGPHHHQWGGTYPCEGPEPCRGCGTLIQPVRFEEPAWPVDDVETRS